jgi:phage replication-related protein YjqB (UPF0714/DUF867 family)
MPDRYENFAHLARYELEGRDYRIRAVPRASPVLVLAPHGGFMEPGTHLVAAFIAGERFSLYCFETLVRRDRATSMHIASTRFDEPRALALLATAEIAIGVHGRKDKDDPAAIWVGGLHEPLRDVIARELATAGVKTKIVDEGHPLSGRDPRNICNRGRRGAGVQLEMPARIRQRLVAEPNARAVFIDAMHSAIERYM